MFFLIGEVKSRNVTGNSPQFCKKYKMSSFRYEDGKPA